MGRDGCLLFTLCDHKSRCLAGSASPPPLEMMMQKSLNCTDRQPTDEDYYLVTDDGQITDHSPREDRQTREV